MGDPAGVGPEIILKALCKDDFLRERCIVYGSIAILEYYSNLLGFDVSFHKMQDTDDFVQNKLNVIDVVDFNLSKFMMGIVDPACGDAAYKCIEKAIYDAQAKKISAVVTAPINKEALQKAGHLYDGHTEIFAKLTKTKKYTMMLIDKNLRVMHVSTHVSLKMACELVKKNELSMLFY
jgi:4-hydroxythreonine-4-phosphate dehydrogenase